MSLGRGVAWLGLWLVLLSCIGGPSRQPVYYSLAGTGQVTARSRTPHSLAVARFAVRAPYDRSELMYRQRERELRFYPFDLWATRPGRMLAEAVTEHLRAAGLFRDVSLGPTLGVSDFELRGEVLALEEHDRPDGSRHARLAMRFELIALADGRVVLRHEFDAERPIGERKVSAVARVLDEILHDQLEVLGGRMAEALPSLADR